MEKPKEEKRPTLTKNGYVVVAHPRFGTPASCEVFFEQELKLHAKEERPDAAVEGRGEPRLPPQDGGGADEEVFRTADCRDSRCKACAMKVALAKLLPQLAKSATSRRPARLGWRVCGN